MPLARRAATEGIGTVDRRQGDPLCSALLCEKDIEMKVVNSLKSAKKRDKNCRIVRRRGRVYVINKLKPRMKARQG